ncbi:hypothetical protein PSHT_14278 [Puccinia striiformis]|uniref:Uncharacterized protein n=1 Tax=Puccinia striiformis TaxID=27350 RepID=A0A2S4UL31_9BASI|nr:hypothetical protein PSHT_14278 [Puccinia striiformis]
MHRRSDRGQQARRSRSPLLTGIYHERLRVPYGNNVTGDVIQHGRRNMYGVQIERRSARSQRTRDLNANHPQRLRILPQGQHDRRQFSTLKLERTALPKDILKAGKGISLYIPRHSRTALSPCLAAPPRIISSISRLGPGGCEKILSKISLPADIHPAATSHSQQNSKLTRAYDLSPSWCSPNLQRSAHRYLVSSEDQNPDNEILAGFLKNNGGYLDDSDDEEEGEGQTTPGNTMMATVEFLKRRIAYPSSFAPLAVRPHYFNLIADPRLAAP